MAVRGRRPAPRRPDFWGTALRGFSPTRTAAAGELPPTSTSQHRRLRNRVEPAARRDEEIASSPFLRISIGCHSVRDHILAHPWTAMIGRTAGMTNPITACAVNFLAKLIAAAFLHIAALRAVDAMLSGQNQTASQSACCRAELLEVIIISLYSTPAGHASAGERSSGGKTSLATHWAARR